MTVVSPVFPDLNAASEKMLYKINQELVCMTKIRTSSIPGKKIVIQT